MIDLVKNLAAVNRRTKSSVIRELLKTTNQPGLISFAGGLPDPDAFPVEIILELTQKVLKNDYRAALQYGPTEGLNPLKEAIAEMMDEDEGISVHPDNILITTASQQGLDLVGRTFIDPGNPIVVELPSYLGGLQAFNAYGAVMHGISADNEGINIEELENTLKTLAKQDEHYKFIYIVPDFQNPSGVTTSEARRREIIRLSEKYNVYVVEDSPYRQTRFEGKAPTMMYAMNPGNVIQLATFSKTFAPGFRLGYVIAHQSIIKKMEVLKQSIDLCSPSFSQLVAAEFIRGGYLKQHIKLIRKIYGKKRDLMTDALKRHMPEGVSWTNPEGGLFLWVRLPEGVDADLLFPKAIEKKVAYVIGSAFHCDGRGKNTMRLNFSYATHEEIEEGIKRLSVVVKDEMAAKKIKPSAKFN